MAELFDVEINTVNYHLKEQQILEFGQLVMPLKNGTQKELGLDPDFRRDDEEGGFGSL